MFEFSGKYRIDFIDEVDSTNSYLKKLARQGRVNAPFCVSANAQTKGRGQRENLWQSEAGKNVQCSFVISVKEVAALSKVNLAAAISIFEVLKSFSLNRLSIKWPNDVFAGDKKIAGILTENVIDNGVVKNSIVGIGLNVDQLTFKDFEATSMKLQTNTTFDRVEIVKGLYDHLYSNLELNERDLLKSVNSMLYKKNEFVTFQTETGIKEYNIVSYLANGNLFVKSKEEYEFAELEHHRIKWLK